MNSSLDGDDARARSASAATEREAVAAHQHPKEEDSAAAASQADKDAGDGCIELLISGSWMSGKDKALNNNEGETYATSEKEKKDTMKKKTKKRKRSHYDQNAQNEGDLDPASATATNSIIPPPEINRKNVQPEISNDNHHLDIVRNNSGGLAAVEPDAPPAASKSGDQIPVGIKPAPSGKWEVHYRYKNIHHPPIYIGTFHTIQAATAVLDNVREEVETRLQGITRNNFSASQLTNTINEAKMMPWHKRSQDDALEKAQRQLQILLTGVLKEADTGKWAASYYCQGKWFPIGTYDTAEDAINAKAGVVAQLEPNGLLPWDDEISNDDAQSIFQAGKVAALRAHASTEAKEAVATIRSRKNEPDDLLYVSFGSDASKDQPDTFLVKLSECTPCTCTLSTDGREKTRSTIDEAKQPSPNNQMRKMIHECLRSIHQSITILTSSCKWNSTHTLLIKDMKEFEVEILSKLSTWDKFKKTFGCFEDFLKMCGFNIWHTERGSHLHTYIYHSQFQQGHPELVELIFPLAERQKLNFPTRKTISEFLRSLNQSITTAEVSCSWHQKGVSTFRIKDMEGFHDEILSRISSWKEIENAFGTFESFLKAGGFQVWQTKCGSRLHTYVYHRKFQQNRLDLAELIFETKSCT